MCASEFDDRNYDPIYQEFDSSLMQEVRREAYGKDIGQHSWVTAEELEEDIPRLMLTPASRLLDLGCGPCGPLVFILGLAGCQGSGVDVSAKAIAAGRARAAALGLQESVTLREADLNGPMPFETGAFNAVLSFDVVLHLRDRAAVFREVARVLVPGGRFLFTDAGIITGPVSAEEIGLRSLHGHTQFVPAMQRALAGIYRFPADRVHRPNGELTEKRYGTPESKAPSSSRPRAARRRCVLCASAAVPGNRSRSRAKRSAVKNDVFG